MQNPPEHITPIALDGPYQKETFQNIWLKHFRPDGTPVEVDCFKGISFIKKGKLPIYANVGATNTKSVIYRTYTPCSTDQFGNAVFLIYDVPDYLGVHPSYLNGLKLKSVPQYQGFLCDLSNFESVEDYLNVTVSKRSRSKLKNYENRLKRDHEVRFDMLWGEISNGQYEVLFERFHSMLVRRFAEKQIVNNNLDPTEWAFFKDLTLPMLRNREAGLFITYVKDRPVAMTLLHFSDTHVYDVIRVFDIAFSHYRIGSISIMHQLEWCIKNNYDVLDFSKGHYDYKERWSTNGYLFHYHIWYNPKNRVSLLIAHVLGLTFKLKYWARKKDLLNMVHKIRYRLGNNP